MAGQNPYSPFNNDFLVTTLTAATAGGNVDSANGTCSGVKVAINITALGGTSPTLTVTIRGKDAQSGSYYTILASTAISATGFTLLTVYPGATVTANESANDHIPQNWNVEWAIGGTTPTVTATIGACLLV